jgi:hypothetical protein
MNLFELKVMTTLPSSTHDLVIVMFAFLFLFRPVTCTVIWKYYTMNIITRHEGVKFHLFFTTLHMLVKHLPKLWKIHNSSVILDNTKKIRLSEIKKCKRKLIHQTGHESLMPNQEICCGICQ